MSDLYEPLEFVFCGFRKGDAGLFISVATLRDGVFAYSHAWRSLNNIHADHSITSMPIAQ